MSLINTMLTDLQSRQGKNQYENDLVFVGLTPVTETRYTKSKVPYNFIIVSVCIVIIGVAFASYFYHGESRAVSQVYSPAQDSDTVETKQQSYSPATALNIDDLLDESTELLPEQRIVETLVADIIKQKSTLDDITTITGIDIRVYDDVTSIELSFDDKVEFSAFTLDEPYRLILELENTRFLETTPPTLEHSYLSSIGYSKLQGGSLRFMMVSSVPILIEDTNVTIDDEAYLLTVKIRPEQQIRQALPDPEISIPRQEESIAGQMEISPSSGGSDANLIRSVAGVRRLYSQKKYQAADAAILEIITDFPLNVEARSLYVSTLIARNRMDQAIQVLASGLSLNPGVAEWTKIYARLLIELGQTSRAIEAMELALPEITADLDYYAMYAALLQKESRHDLAIETYKSLLLHKPNNSIWWMGLAISQDAISDSGNALYSYNMALKGQSMDFELRKYILEQIQRLSN
jgi:hypothetical protein